MSNHQPSLTDVLFSKTRQRILKLLFSCPNDDFHTNDIIRLTKVGSGTVQRELEKLAKVGIILVKKVGNQKRYQANQSSPIFNELSNIIAKTVGISNIIKTALQPYSKRIRLAFIFGSIAKKEDKASSDIDVMIITSDLTYSDIFQHLEQAEQQLQRNINPTIYNVADWKRKLEQNNHFLVKIMQQPKIFIIGNEDELQQLMIMGSSITLKVRNFQGDT